MGENLTFAPRKIKGLFITRDMSKKSNASKGREFWRRLGKVILILFAISILLPILYRWVNPPVTTFQLVQAVSNGTGIHKKWVPIEKISPYMYRAAIASEDNYFLGHNGFDVIALNTVMEERKSGRRKRGGSTISQQTAKNVFCWPKSSWVRKGVETYFTFLIETFWSKERIMEVYLNVIEMGPGIYGAEKAAQTYFHCHASHIAAILQLHDFLLQRNSVVVAGQCNHGFHSLRICLSMVSRRMASTSAPIISRFSALIISVSGIP